MFWKSWFEPKAFHEGYLPEKDGHRVFFREFGNKKGKTILIFHGGPGGFCKPRHAKAFNLRKYRVIMFDQRGCGMSQPEGQWNKNTTADLIDDAKRILDVCGVKDKVIIRGGSWGSTLALKFAETYPEKVEALLLSQIFLANNESREWEEEGTQNFYPDIWEQIEEQVPDNDLLLSYYAGLINSGEKEKQETALTYYGAYERLLGSLNPRIVPKEADEKNVASARIYMNYANKRFYLKDDELMKNIKKISWIPTLIVHNRLDFVCPLKGAYRLHKAMKNSKLVIVPEKGHVGMLLHQTIRNEIKEFLKNISA